MLELELIEDNDFEELQIEDDPTKYTYFADIRGQVEDNQTLVKYIEENGGKIDKIKVNGTEQPITDKTVDLSVPTKTSDLTNDSGYQNETQVNTKIDVAKRQIRNEIPVQVSDLDNDLGFQTGQQVEATITSKDYATNTKVDNAILDLEDSISEKASQDSVDDLTERVDANEDDIDDIQSLIPSEASTTNQLADKEFVNSSITTNTAFFRGTFNVVDDLGLTYNATHEQVIVALGSVVLIKTNNDYVFVYFTNPTTQIIERYDRYKYSTDLVNWQFEYTLNNSSFTAVQWEAINSGITTLGVAQITANQNAIATLNTSLTNLATRVGSAETNITNLQTSIATLQTSIATLQSGKISKVVDGVSGNLTVLTSDGSVEDSGISPLYWRVI